MIILAIETSCDDTCMAVVEAPDKKRDDFKILSNIVSSQIEIHKKWGGVYPSLAKKEHQRNLPLVLIHALKESKLLKNQKSKIKYQNCPLFTHSKSKIKIIENILEREPKLLKKILPFFKKYQRPDVDLIAVTVGPGLEPCLWVGVNFARVLAYFWNLPIIPVNHIEAHIIANWLPPINSKSKIKNQKSKIIFPAVCLVASGGHTQLILMKKIGKYEILGETRDDAAGECFDKTARILGLGYPGGPAIAANAAKLKIKNLKLKINLPRPMINSKNYDFSFSGLKTAVLYKNKESRIENKEYIEAMCYEIQQAVIDVLIKKTIKAAKNYKAKTIILGGGVAANEELRRQFKLKIENCKLKINFLVPPKNLCTDNALMTAIAGYYHQKEKTKNWRKIKADANLRI